MRRFDVTGKATCGLINHTFILAVACMVLSGSFQRVINTATVAVVILISLKAAGIHLAAIVVTGGAIGFAVGIGLQKIGSNMVGGIMLLIRKPIRQGDVIAFDKSFARP